MIDILVTTPKKGSNPGGKCIIEYGNSCVEAYIKYCPSGRLGKDNPLTHIHQPIYESTTILLAEKLGLVAPTHHIIDTNHDKINIRYQIQLPKKERLDDSQEFYFVSRLLDEPDIGDEKRIDILMNPQIQALDLLMIGDIIGRKQNYSLIGKPYEHIVYLDLGCSFVDAHEGAVSQRNRIKKLSELIYDKFDEPNSQDIKNARKFLHNNPITVEGDKIQLDELIESIPELSIPFIPEYGRKLKEVISQRELNEIQGLFLLNMQRVLKKNT